MADDYSAIMQVELVPHVVIDKVMTLLGPEDKTIEFEQFQVFVCGERIKAVNGTERIHVGYIGKQAMANFCPVGLFYKLTTSQGNWVAEQAKKLHGKASPEPHVFVPPPLI